MEDKQRKEKVSQYYGELGGSDDLKTTACCSIDSFPLYIRKLLANVNNEIKQKFYGCGSPIPYDLKSIKVLDLGCGTGRDCYIVSQLVGQEGEVVGVDMTDEQLEIANKYLDYHREKFSYTKSNVTFKKADIEDLSMIEDDYFDLVISNCVINLSNNKEKVFKEIFRVLKKGGELYFSDIFSDRRIPKEYKSDKVIVGECLGGALYIEDFRRLLQKVDINDYRIISKGKIDLKDQNIENKIGDINFYSLTIRVFNCDFEDICEDYGQVAYYLGTVEQSPHKFILDDHHTFYTNKAMLVCGNTAKMITETRYAKHFKVIGDTSKHYGKFKCVDENKNEDNNSCC